MAAIRLLSGMKKNHDCLYIATSIAVIMQKTDKLKTYASDLV